MARSSAAWVGVIVFLVAIPFATPDLWGAWFASALGAACAMTLSWMRDSSKKGLNRLKLAAFLGSLAGAAIPVLVVGISAENLGGALGLGAWYGAINTIGVASAKLLLEGHRAESLRVDPT